MTKYYYGACYYPELYPEERREEFICQDIQRMRAARFNVVRMAEFTWCLMEPKEGVFDFDWLERHVNQLGENGIDTIWCTPTASPFGWRASILRRCTWIIRVCGAAMAEGTIIATTIQHSGNSQIEFVRS